ncbi:TnsA endonuclease N-terminal domain-containing protein [Paenibacillus sp. P25]|nr:TnsA endonuclease N-terminal domain-containing protein [Paenibacillus sp. P25]
MAKRKYSFDEDTLKKRLNEGRGSGFGPTYKPWILVHEVPSKGKSNIKQGWKTGRDHHLLSTLETNYFYTVEWDDRVLDIREQYPLLPREETQEIASSLGILHPRDNKTKTDIVLTTDIVITERVGLSNSIATRTVKYEEDLQKQRTKEKLLIEKVYWRRRSVEWKIVTENSIKRPLVWNVEWLYKNYSMQGHFYGVEQAVLQKLELLLLELVHNLNTPLISITDETDRMLKLPCGTSMTMVKHLIAIKKIKVNMNKKINPSKPLSLLHA